MLITPASRTAAAGAFAAAALLALSACGSSNSSNSGATTPPPPASSSTTNSAPGLMTAKDAKLGTVVTDAQGFTLYRFDNDTASPPKSNCSGQCAATWPAAAAVQNSAVKGVDQKLVGSVTRADGSKQVTLHGWPLYRYGGDSKPGDTNGQGIGGTWFAADPDGSKTGGAPEAPTSPAPTTPGSNGY
ncbi:hypothetical protein QMK19_32130 [Streptomyces sp. H10-C2]|uniref:hypothetical protein n=1 Tax=unclassified Streptomyces TaxID=2593676 RepID=UPI0024B91B06|nr:MULTISPECIES: hypothetical protein [unclassified Streptomyces]MDJ0346394.1 hypothetical protein [Streptomyces sp. PH10-H1]MDJ0374157.1 hypothetical protein [Streptomyces sp. H10-C2]